MIPDRLECFSVAQQVGAHGFIRLVDVMGDDDAIVQAARVSYGAGTKSISSDRNLIRYLMRHKHTSPFEMCEIKLHVKAPIHVLRQWIRHRMANTNEVSTRYSVVEDCFENFVPVGVRLQSANNKQGSNGLLFDTDSELAAKLADKANEVIDHAYDTYNMLIENGVAREQARNILPLATYSECYWKIDLHNLLHFLKLRLDLHAQQEIRDFGTVLKNIVRLWVPVATEAFEDYSQYAHSFSQQEIKCLNAFFSSHKDVNQLLSDLNASLSSREFTEIKNVLGLDKVKEQE